MRDADTDHAHRGSGPAADGGPDALVAADRAAHEARTTLGSRAVRGFHWALVGNLFTKFGSFGVSLIMVRLLAPEQFGLYAVALAANAFVMHVNDMGIIAATVQWPGDVRRMLATARTMAIGFSLLWYGAFWVAAPTVAALAGSPDATLLVRLLTLTVVIDGITGVSVAMIQRRFEHDRLMKSIAVGCVFWAVVTVTSATQGAGAYSFVAGALTQSVVVAVLVLRIAGLRFRLGFDREVARRLFRFGTPLAVALGIESVLLFADSMIVGNLLGTVALGYYLLAFNISSWVPGIVGTAARYVSIPAFSRLAEGASSELEIGVRKALPLMVGFVVPIAVQFYVLATPMIEVLYGARWVPAADVLRFLAFVMVARMVTALVFDIQIGLGNTRTVVWVNLGWLAFLAPALWFGARLDGIQGAAMGHAVVSVCIAIPLAGWMLHRCGVHMGPVLRQVVRPLAAGVAAGLVTAALALVLDGAVTELLVAGGAGLVTYVVLVVPAPGRAIVRQRLLPGGSSRTEVVG